MSLFIDPISRWGRLFFTCVALFCLTALVACGGGSDSDGSNSSEETNNGGSSVNTAPTAAITSPLDGDACTYGETITFTGSGSDAEDGTLSGEALVWTSDLDGAMGTGAAFTSSDLSWGAHTITLTATDSSGETASDSIMISVKAWRHPADLSDNISPDGQPAMDPEVAMDGNGNAVIVWNQYNGSNYQVFMSEYRDGAWSHPEDLDDSISPDGSDIRFPQVAMDSSGNAVITWYQSDGSNGQVFMSEYRDGVWSHPTDLNDNISPDGSDVGWPLMAMDDSGNAIITWGQNNQIFMSEYREGVWAHPAGLDDNISPDGTNASAPRVAMGGNGDAVITWLQSDGSYYQIFMSEYRDGAWTHPADLDDNISPNGQTASVSQVAMDSSGNAVIVWSQSDGSNMQVFKSEYRVGLWAHPADVSDNISPDEKNALSPWVAMDGNGNAVIVWYQSDGSNSQIFMSECRDGAWTHPEGLDDNISPNGQRADDPRVVMNDSGDAVIAWLQRDGSYYQIFMSEYRDGAWTHPVGLDDNISPDGTYCDYGPRIAMDVNGDAVIAWRQSDGSNSQIFMSEYN